MHTFKNLLCLLALAALQAVPGGAQTATVTATRLAGGYTYDLSGDGSTIVFQSCSDLTGDNPEEACELFTWRRHVGYTQLTDTNSDGGYRFSDPQLDRLGRVVTAVAHHFLGSTATNLYRWEEGLGWEQLTFGGRVVQRVSMSADGRRIAFSSYDDYTGQNPDAEWPQLFLWDQDTGIRQITYGPCGQYGTHVFDLNAYGDRIMFDSPCDLDGLNPDLQNDIFLWDETDGFTNLTNGATTRFGYPALNAVGDIAAVVSPHDLAGDGTTGYHLYRWLEGDGFTRLTTEPIRYYYPRISLTGHRIAFDAKNGQGGPTNSDGHDEVFLWEEGRPRPVALTENTVSTYGNFLPKMDDSGTRFVLEAARAFSPPEDPRDGIYVLDVFSLEEKQPNLLKNPRFDDADVLTDWDAAGALWDSRDGMQNSESGSFHATNSAASPMTTVAQLSQCVEVTPSTTYLVSALINVPPAAVSGQAWLSLKYYSQADCAPASLHGFSSPASRHLQDDHWTTEASSIQVLSTTRGLRVVLETQKADAGGFFEAYYDDVALRRVPANGELFVDGFESGDLSAWSLHVGGP